MNLFRQHLEAVNACQICPSGFSRSPSGKFYRFPPLIGATRHAIILFVGINPRISETNRWLHERLINSEESFRNLAGNRLDDGSPYISLNAVERHYHSHMLVVHGVFGSECAFETVAAVTELSLCASTDAPSALQAKSVCAQKHLETSMNIIKPQVVVAVGATVKKHVTGNFGNLLAMPPVEMEHPRFHFNLSLAEKRRRLQPVVDAIKTFLR